MFRYADKNDERKPNDWYGAQGWYGPSVPSSSSSRSAAPAPSPSPSSSPSWRPQEGTPADPSLAALGPDAQVMAADATSAPAPGMPDERDVALSNMAAIKERWAKDDFFQRTLAKYGKGGAEPAAAPAAAELAATSHGPAPMTYGPPPAVEASTTSYGPAHGDAAATSSGAAPMPYGPAPAADMPAATAATPSIAEQAAAATQSGGDERATALSRMEASEERWGKDSFFQQTLAKYAHLRKPQASEAAEPAPAPSPVEPAPAPSGPTSAATAMPDEREIALSNMQSIKDRWAKDDYFQQILAKYGKRAA